MPRKTIFDIFGRKWPARTVTVKIHFVVDKNKSPYDGKVLLVLKSYLNRFMVSISGINPKVGVMIHGHAPG